MGLTSITLVYACSCLGVRLVVLIAIFAASLNICCGVDRREIWWLHNASFVAADVHYLFIPWPFPSWLEPTDGQPDAAAAAAADLHPRIKGS